MRSLLVLTSIALLAAAGPAFAAGKTSGKKVHKSDKVAVCDGLVEKRLALAIELETLDSRVAEKNKAIRDLSDADAKDLPAIDLTADAEVVDLTADPQNVEHRDRLAKIVTLQNEIVTLDESRLAVERKAAKVASTLSQQSCPK